MTESSEKSPTWTTKKHAALIAAVARIRAWLARKARWMTDGGRVWLSCALIVGTAIVSFRWPGPDFQCYAPDVWVRVWGMLLQLIGVWTVWLDLNQTARQFDKDPLPKRFVSWLRDGFRGANRTISISGTAVSVASASARMTVRHPMQEGWSIEQRIEAAEFNLQQVEKELGEALTSIDKTRTDCMAAAQEATKLATQEVAKVRQHLEHAVAGNFSNLAFGAFWLAVGVVIATLSPEISRLSADGSARAIALGATISAGTCPP